MMTKIWHIRQKCDSTGNTERLEGIREPHGRVRCPNGKVESPETEGEYARTRVCSQGYTWATADRGVTAQLTAE